MSLALPSDTIAEIQGYEQAAKLLVVESDDDYRGAGDFLLGIKALAEVIDEKLDPNIKRWHDGHKAALAEKAEYKEPLVAAERLIKGKLDVYRRAQEQKRLEEAERLRKEAEAQERARRDAESASLRAQAVAANDADLLAVAESVAAEPVYVAPVTVEPAVPKVAGISHKENWDAEVFDLLALVRHVAEHPEHLNLLQSNPTALRQMAKSLKKRLALPGVRAVDKGGVSASTGRK